MTVRTGGVRQQSIWRSVVTDDGPAFGGWMTAPPAASEPPSMHRTGYLETTDGAKVYYEDRGEGQPILLVHGWMCSSRFWQKNVPTLASKFRVVTLDLRGHGNSSKSLAGHTIAQYGRDIRALIEHLELRDVVLVGWSLAGPVVLSYYRQHGIDHRLKALGLIDATPFPFSPAPWNSHALRDWNYDGLNETLAQCTADPRHFANAFAARMFSEKPADAEMTFAVTELMKTPPWIAAAIYSDFVMSDCSSLLPAIATPVIVYAANSKIFRDGIAMGRAIASQVPLGTCVPFEEAGHLLFFEQPQKFNATLAAFIDAL